MKLFVCADIEGCCGITDWSETRPGSPQSEAFRKQMTEEVAAVCRGALEAGFDRVVVRDAHDSARNLLPELLPEQTRIYRGWTGDPYGMLSGLDGSFAGVVVEILWCLFRNGYIESRSGLVYGPFNPVYGIGAVVMTLALYRYRNRSSSISFFGGAVVGSVIEYLLSWGQETLFGSTSWDYSRMPFNLDGRICLLYSLFWGILGVLWIKSLYPRVAQVILKIPNRFGKVLTWVLTIFMVFDCAMSLLAVDRWSERVRGETPVSAVDVFFDEHFPDSRMERIYANMEFGTNPA